jgi:hypothetical protein
MKMTELADYFDAIGGPGAKLLARQCRLLLTPIDFDALIAAGKLRRLSARCYEVLADDLPDAVWAQAVGVAGGPAGTVLNFRRRTR